MALLYYMLCQLRGSKANWYAGMAELADAHGSGPCDYCSHEGSSPFSCILINDAAEQFNTQEWRNWQTRTVQVRVTIAVMRVQVPFPALSKSAEKICWFLRVRLAAHVSNGWKSLIHPSSGKDIAKTKGVLFIECYD